mgnify:FL=1
MEYAAELREELSRLKKSHEKLLEAAKELMERLYDDENDTWGVAAYELREAIKEAESQ